MAPCSSSKFLPIFAIILTSMVTLTRGSPFPAEDAEEERHNGREGNCHGQCLSYGVTGPLSCDNSIPSGCDVSSVAVTTITCDALKAAAIPEIDPTLYGGGANMHLVPLAHRYYYSRMNKAFGSCCPTNVQEISQMALTVPWTGNHGKPAGQAWDIGYRARAFRRSCTFPTGEWPFICTGVDGTSGVDGSSLGNLYNYPLLTNNATTGNGVWTLFGQCWDSITPTDSTGSNSPVSWNVFTTDGTGVISAPDKNLIKGKLASLGFATSGKSFLSNTF